MGIKACSPFSLHHVFASHGVLLAQKNLQGRREGGGVGVRVFIESSCACGSDMYLGRMV